MKTKLTLTDCYKYPNAVIREYKRDKVIHEYKNLLELLAFKCVTVWIKPKYQLKEANKYLAKCKLHLRTLDSLTEQEKNDLLDIALKDKCLKVLSAKDYSHGNFDNDLFQLDIKRTNYLRSISLDIDGLEQSGRAVYE